MSILYALMAFCLSAMSAAEEFDGVEYPKIQRMQGLDITKVEGEWPLFATIGVSGVEERYDCPIPYIMDYVNPEVDGFTVLMFDPNKRGKVLPTALKVSVPDPDEPARLLLKFEHTKIDTVILGTDYVSYMVTCMHGEMHKNGYGIQFYVRDRKADVSGGYKVIEKTGINATNLARTMRSYRCKSQNEPTA